jgi:hypothetical protein
MQANPWTAADGTPLFHGGLMIAYQDYVTARDIGIAGVPGYATSPPGETFGKNIYQCLYALLEHIVINGRNIGGTLLGINNSDYTVMNDVHLNNCGHGAGLAVWQSKGFTMNGGSLAGNRRPLNCEKVTGLCQVNNVDFRGATEWPHITINNGGQAGDPYLGSAQLIVRAPILEAGQPLRIAVFSKYNGFTQTQKISDIHVFDAAGVEITNDTAKVVFNGPSGPVPGA